MMEMREELEAAEQVSRAPRQLSPRSSQPTPSLPTPPVCQAQTAEAAGEEAQVDSTALALRVNDATTGASSPVPKASALTHLASPEWCAWFYSLDDAAREKLEAEILALDFAGQLAEQAEAADREDGVVILAIQFVSTWGGGGGGGERDSPLLP